MLDIIQVGRTQVGVYGASKLPRSVYGTREPAPSWQGFGDEIRAISTWLSTLPGDSHPIHVAMLPDTGARVSDTDLGRFPHAHRPQPVMNNVCTPGHTTRRPTRSREAPLKGSLLGHRYRARPRR